jgi:hypothetical protein
MALPHQFVADAVYHVADFLELRVFFEVEENPEGVLDRNDDAEMGHAVSQSGNSPTAVSSVMQSARSSSSRPMIERTLCKTLARSIMLPINSSIDASPNGMSGEEISQRPTQSSKKNADYPFRYGGRTRDRTLDLSRVKGTAGRGFDHF